MLRVEWVGVCVRGSEPRGEWSHPPQPSPRKGWVASLPPPPACRLSVAAARVGRTAAAPPPARRPLRRRERLARLTRPPQPARTLPRGCAALLLPRRPPPPRRPSIAAPPSNAAPRPKPYTQTTPCHSCLMRPRPGGWWPVLLTGRQAAGVVVYLVEAIGYGVERQVIASQLRPTSCGLSSSKVAPAAPATTNLGCGQATGRPGAVAGAGSRTSSRARVTSERALSSCETW